MIRGARERGVAGLRASPAPSPRVPASRCETTGRGYVDSRHTARGLASASANVVGSGTVGPDPITAGSSFVTSDRASVTIRARVAAASRPPLTAERCFRTQLTSPMSAFAASSRRVISRLSSSVSRRRGRPSAPKHRRTAARAGSRRLRASPPAPVRPARPPRCARRAPDASSERTERPRIVHPARSDRQPTPCGPAIEARARHRGRRPCRRPAGAPSRERQGQCGSASACVTRRCGSTARIAAETIAVASARKASSVAVS